MTLQTFFGGIYAAIGTYIIPLIIFLCVTVFLINVIRFFIWQSGSEDGREKARRYMVWSMLGFVFIIALWGIISLLLTTLGFNNVDNTAPCPDYNPLCNSGAPAVTSSAPGGSFGSPTIPTSPGATPGSSGASPTSPAPTQPTTASGSGSSPTTNTGNPGLTGGNYSTVGTGSLNSVGNLPAGSDSYFYNQLSLITVPDVLDERKLEIAAAFEAAGVISTPEFNAIVNEVNSVRVTQGFAQLSLGNITVDQGFVQNIEEFYDDTTVAQQQLANLYTVNQNPTLPTPSNTIDANTIAATNVNDFFDTSVPLNERMSEADALLSALGSTALLEETLGNAFWIEANQTNTPVNFNGNNFTVQY